MHRDDSIDFENGSADLNQGNYIDPVRFRAETDEVLADHLKNAPRNALYTIKMSTMTSDRLSGLAMMKINRDQCQQLQDSPGKLSQMVEIFAQVNPRRMKLPFVLYD